MALAKEARGVAEEVEDLYISLEQIGALASIRRFMISHQEGVQDFDLLQTAKALRCYAGVLSMMATAVPKSTARPEQWSTFYLEPSGARANGLQS